MIKNKIFESNNLTIYHTVLGLLSNNVYLLVSGNVKALVDPSCREDDIANFVGNSLDKVLITHYHFDHIGAAQYIKDKYDAKTYASKIDTPYIEQTEELPVMHRRVKPCKVDTQLTNNDYFSIGNTKWSVIETPGHSMGSICFYCKDENILISGDTLFYGSCGRTDFVDSSPEAMIESLNTLSKLPDNTLVFPGHGEFTTIGEEKNFISQLRL